MGMDVHGLNPKQNKSMKEFPILFKYEEMTKDDDDDDGFKQKWKELDNDKELREQYWKEEDEYQKINNGVYFRNNCWWWRPLWDYCKQVAPDLIDNELYQAGHNNSGAGLDDKGAKALGTRLLQEINDGKTIKYQAEYQQQQDDSDDKFASYYPFDIDNVKEFADFCIQSGGFEIC